MRPITPKAKRNLLRRLIEIEIILGYDVTDLVGRQLSYFNWDAVYNKFELAKVEFKNNNKTDYEH
jgi:hypothetical protein